MEIMAVLILLPLMFGIGVLVCTAPLYFTTKFFKVNDSSFLMALKVTVLAWLASLAIGLVMGIIGMAIPVLPWLLSTVAPFAVYVFLIQHFYHLELVSALIISIVQVIVTFVLGLAFVFAIAIPMGLLGAFSFF